MSHSENHDSKLVELDLDAAQRRRQERLQEAAKEMEAAGLDATALLEMVRDAEQWTVEDQPEIQIPYSVSSVLTVALRDEGNNLLRESQEVNGRFAGQRYDGVKMMLGADLLFIDLCDRSLDWAGRVAQQLLHSTRNKAKADPLMAYHQCLANFAGFVGALEPRFERSIYELVWGPVLTWVGYRLIDALLLERGLIRLEADPSGSGDLRMRGPLGSGPDADDLEAELRHFGHVSAAFTEQALLPRLRDQAERDSSQPLPLVEARYRAMVADLFEAYPLLIHHADEIVTFPVPGLQSPGYFLFTEVGGIAGFGLASISSPLLTLQWDGQMGFAGLPARTLQDRYGREEFVRVASWLVEQVHAAVVDSYLVAVEEARIRLQSSPTLATGDAGETPDVASYVAWVRQAQEEAQDQTDERPTEGVPISRIRQLRRNLFFKVLRHCGVQVEQGKGSEIKLLRDGKRPFLMGDHGYANPTIPAFLAASILRRLEITYGEWRAALAAAA